MLIDYGLLTRGDIVIVAKAIRRVKSIFRRLID